MTTKFLILGDGRLASHLIYYFSLLGLDYEQWSRKHNLNDDLKEMSQSCSHVIFLIKDDVIEDFVRLPIWRGKILIHCSGSLSISNCFSVHPLMTFSHELYEINDYKTIPFIIDSLAPEFDQLLPGVPNLHLRIKEDLKPLYHALCVCGGNFMTILWQMVFNESTQSLGINHHAYLPYMQRIVKNLELNPETALTGPFVRKDYSTIEKNLYALKETKLEMVYEIFKKLYFEDNVR